MRKGIFLRELSIIIRSLTCITILLLWVVFFFVEPQEVSAESEDDQISISCTGTRKFSNHVGKNHGDIQEEKIDLFLFIDDEKKILKQGDGSVLCDNCQTWTRKIINHHEKLGKGFRGVYLNRTNGALVIEGMKFIGPVTLMYSISATCEEREPMF